MGPSATTPRPRSSRWLILCAAAAVAGVLAAYSNHFHNSFHFDDGTVIQNNAYLRSLKNIPLFFRDATTFSSLPANAVYRPLTSVSFALDYWRSSGLDTFAFHQTQWALHLLLGSPALLLPQAHSSERGARPAELMARALRRNALLPASRQYRERELPDAALRDPRHGRRRGLLRLLPIRAPPPEKPSMAPALRRRRLRQAIRDHVRPSLCHLPPALPG